MKRNLQRVTEFLSLHWQKFKRLIISTLMRILGNKFSQRLLGIYVHKASFLLIFIFLLKYS